MVEKTIEKTAGKPIDKIVPLILRMTRKLKLHMRRSIEVYEPLAPRTEREIEEREALGTKIPT